MPHLGGILKRVRTKDDAASQHPPLSLKRSDTASTADSAASAGSRSSGIHTPPTSQPSHATLASSYTTASTTASLSSSPSGKSANGTMTNSNAVQPPQAIQRASTFHQEPPSQTARVTKGKYHLTDFAIQRTLGTGSFGRVHLVQSKHNSRFYAVKVLKKQQVVKMKQVEHTNDERKMLGRVKHPFLITLWGTFQDSKNLYMVMDFVEGGELFSLLRKSQVCHPAYPAARTIPHSTFNASFECRRPLMLTVRRDFPIPSPSSTLQRSPSLWIICTRATSSTAISSLRTCCWTDMGT